MESKINEEELNEILDRRAEREDKGVNIDIALMFITVAILIAVKYLFF